MPLARGSWAQKEFQINFRYMSLAQQIYVTYVFKPNLLYNVELMYFELSGDDAICSNCMSFRIIGS